MQINMDNQILLKFRKEKEDLVSLFLKGDNQFFIKNHSEILDHYFYESFEGSRIGPVLNIFKNPYAIIALGGYGREEQCLCSDIDLLFLFKNDVPAEAEKLIQEIIYPLWDLGYDVGHSTRSMKECLQLAHANMDVFTSLLDARFLCGMSTLYFELKEKISTLLIQGRSKKLVSDLVKKNMERHHRFGDSTYLLEPNIKEGQGGLRDYHTMLWITKIKSRLTIPRDLEYNGHLSHDEYESLTRALAFIWLVRNHLHHLFGRKMDQLSFSFQEKLSKVMGFKMIGKQMAVERFLGTLHGRMELIKQYNLMVLSEFGYSYVTEPKRKSPAKKSKVDGLTVSGNMLYFSSSQLLMANPILFLKIFEESARLKIPLSSEAKRLIKDFSHLINKQFRSAAENMKIFEQILLKPAVKYNVLNEMLNTGFLSCYIPELQKIVNRIQYDTYHLYPVDRHSLFTVRTIKSFAGRNDNDEFDLCHRLYQEIGAKRVLLLWAALLHDIGKGEDDGNHSEKGAEIVKKVMKRFGYKPNQIETVSFLVSQHLFLIKTATRRDIHDEETVIACARRIVDPKRLKMLYLLTVGDSISTGPKAWNDWTSTLLRDLFFKVLKILEKGELATSKAVETVMKKKADTIGLSKSEDERKSLEGHFDILSPRYKLYVSSDDIYAHKELYQTLGKREFVWDIRYDRKSDTRKVTVCAKDRPGLFSKIAGVFTMNSLDILDAQAYTWRNGVVLDIFRVKPPADQVFENEKWKKAEKNLEQVLIGSLDLDSEMKRKKTAPPTHQSRHSGRPNRINIDNKSSSFFTIIEVFTSDSPGLLYRITDVFFKKGYNVHVAIIATKIDQVVDIFYIRNAFGEKIDHPDEVKALKQSVDRVLSAVS
ncbi:MAG: [protein-PII] uridylyltransferase [Desulfobacteraceae bacterium]|nr:MAG: [protein-PII] uridylyltransferase [Desulfobacteraceae bacterium]